MDEKRRLELLAYAKVCFEKCTNPFETTHLIKKKVTADECRYLSYLIAEVIEGYLGDMGMFSEELEGVLKQAEKDFAETQEGE